MKFRSFKWIFLSLFILYSLSLFLWGDSGLNAMKKQLNIEKELHRNLSVLVSTNEKLNKQLDSYRYDPETIIIQARELGYIQEGEKMLFVKGISDSSHVQKPGNVILPQTPSESGEKIIRAFFFISMILTAAFSLLRTLKGTLNHKH